MLVILADTTSEVKAETQTWLEWELNRANTEANFAKGVRKRAAAEAVRSRLQSLVETYRATALTTKREPSPAKVTARKVYQAAFEAGAKARADGAGFALLAGQPPGVARRGWIAGFEREPGSGTAVEFPEDLR